MQETAYKEFYLDQLGVTRWRLRKQNSGISLDQLANQVAQCTACPLHKTRTQTVFFRGNPTAKLMIIGEAPGFFEDQQGRPFVGKAGMLLNKMLLSIGLDESQVYIANVIKCRPPENRDPQPAEISACSNHLESQIALVNPACILAVGRFSGQYLLNETSTMQKMRNKVAQFKSKPVIVTYHPAYLLRNPRDKAKAYQDLLKIKHFL
jgi:uracil-DNA glycosylase family 4